MIKESARAVSERDLPILAEKMEKLQKAQEEEEGLTRTRTSPCSRRRLFVQLGGLLTM